MVTVPFRTSGNRNRHDWLRVTDLLAGEREQYGVEKDGAAHTVQLAHDRVRDDFIVIVTVERGDTTSTAQHAFGRDVGQARRAFSRLVQTLKQGAQR